jgi:hypothetical protein
MAAGIGCRRAPLAPELIVPPRNPRGPAPAVTSDTRPVELIAVARGNVMAVTLINKMSREIMVGPKFFAVVAGNQVYPADPKLGFAVTDFPIKALKRNEGASAFFRYSKLPTLEGQKIVFYIPKIVRETAEIKPYAVKPSAAAAGPEPPPSVSPREVDRTVQTLLKELERKQPRPR